MYQQHGDLLLKKCVIANVFVKEFGCIPPEAKPTGSNLLLKGEQNNHAVYGGEFVVLEHGGTRFLKVTKPCVLDHVKDLVTMERAEHRPQTVEVGEYFVDQVNEYDHLKEESRKIID